MTEQLIKLWLVRLPEWLARWSLGLGDAVADGAWTVGWRRVTAFAPLAALGIGFLAPLIWPWMRHVYSESLLFMVLVVAGGILSGPVGLMLLVGYIAGDLLVRINIGYSGDSAMPHLVRQLGGQLISYVLLAIPALAVPLAATRMARQVSLQALPPDPMIRHAAQGGLYAAGCGLLIYLWCQAMIVLIRPVFTWLGSQPTREAIYPVQHDWDVLVMGAVLAAAARVVLEEFIVRRGPLGLAVLGLEQQRQRGVRAQSLWQRLPVLARVGLSSAAVTLLLSGTYVSWIDPLLTLVTTVILGISHAALVRWLPGDWARLVRKVPALVRVAVAPFVGYILATILLKLLWFTQSFRPVMLGALVTVAVFYLFFPPAPTSAAQASEDGRRSR